MQTIEELKAEIEKLKADFNQEFINQQAGLNLEVGKRMGKIEMLEAKIEEEIAEEKTSIERVKIRLSEVESKTEKK